MSKELEEIKNEVLRKIGRNVVLFQKIEQMIKLIILCGNSEGYLNDLKTKLEEKSISVRKKTMGQLVGNLIEEVFQNSETTNIPEQPKEVWFSYKFNIECDKNFYEERKKTLALIVAERNDLVHHFLPKWNFNSVDGGKTTEKHLDQQHEKLLPEFEYLKMLADALMENLSFLSSDNGLSYLQKNFELFLLLRKSTLGELLFWIAKEKARSDGWIDMNEATHLISQNAPEEITDLKKNHKKLKDVLLATELFDTKVETTSKGGTRVLYRIKPDLIDFS